MISADKQKELKTQIEKEKKEGESARQLFDRLYPDAITFGDFHECWKAVHEPQPEKTDEPKPEAKKK